MAETEEQVSESAYLPNDVVTVELSPRDRKDGAPRDGGANMVTPPDDSPDRRDGSSDSDLVENPKGNRGGFGSKIKKVFSRSKKKSSDAPIDPVARISSSQKDLPEYPRGNDPPRSGAMKR